MIDSKSSKELRRVKYREWLSRKRQDPVWLANRRKRECARVCAYYAANPDKKREQWRKFTAKAGIQRRVAERVRKARKVLESGKPYSPRYYMRKPEWMPVGKSVGDVRSSFLSENITPEMRDYARGLALERRSK